MGSNEDKCADEFLGDFSRALLPTSEFGHRPHLSSLSYELWHEQNSHFKFPNNRNFPKTFTIPLDRIPYVSTLTLTTCTRVIFARDSEVGVNGDENPSRLQEIHFVECDDMDKGGFQAVVKSLRDVRAWETIEKVVVNDCHSLAYGGGAGGNGEEEIVLFKMMYRTFLIY